MIENFTQLSMEGEFLVTTFFALENMMENTTQHKKMVSALAKPGEDILATLTPESCHIWHMASCIPSEAGEVFDAVKKHVIYGKELDRNHVIEELGDLEFYMEGLRQALGITREETIQQNIAKLSVRYASGKYSDKEAQLRADKGPEEGSHNG